MNNPGTVIMIVSDMNEILAEVDVDETRVVRVEPGQKSSVIVDAVGVGEPYNGTVDEIAGSAVTRTGTAVQVFPVKILLDTKDRRLRPGMTARARIETQKADAAIVVPIQAVVLRPQSEIDEALAGKKADEKAEAKPADSLAPTDKEVVFKVVDGKRQILEQGQGSPPSADGYFRIQLFRKQKNVYLMLEGGASYGPWELLGTGFGLAVENNDLTFSDVTWK